VYYEQTEYEIKCEWGQEGIMRLAPGSDVVVIVDTLSFSTCVDIAVSRGAIVYPYKWADMSSAEFASRVSGVVAGPTRSADGYMLSPRSLLNIPAGTKLVLPSPNGSTLTLSTEGKPTLAGCLRNARAVASAVQQYGARVLVVPAGERWPDQALRPCIEDLIAAGAIIAYMRGTKSPEALVAQAAFMSVADDLGAVLRSCSSGRELIERGFAEDVDLAGQLNVSDCAPLLTDGAYRRKL
jgi:2-phosphosulfolactate phosphatase